jgi:hypothetical protein
MEKSGSIDGTLHKPLISIGTNLASDREA